MIAKYKLFIWVEKEKKAKQQSKAKQKQSNSRKQSPKVKMEDIAEFIIQNGNASEKLSFSVMSLLTEENLIDEFCSCFYSMFDSDDFTDIERFDENLNCQRAVILSFKYKNVKCCIVEHYDTQVDYWCVRIEPC